MTFAYLDPGSGSMMAQAAVAGVAGAAVAVKVGWRRVSSSLRKGKKQLATGEVQLGEK